MCCARADVLLRNAHTVVDKGSVQQGRTWIVVCSLVCGGLFRHQWVKITRMYKYPNQGKGMTYIQGQHQNDRRRPITNNKRLTVCRSLKTCCPCFTDFPSDGCYIRTNVFKRVPHAHRRSPGAKSGVLSRHQEAGFVA